MKKLLCLSVAILLTGCGVVNAPTPDTGRKVPPCPVNPQPDPKPVCPAPDPHKPRRPWGECHSAPVGAKVGGRTSPDGKEEINCDLPGEFHIHNQGGSDGLGLCVFASMHHSGVWNNDPLFDAIFQWMRSHPGGGYPEKVDAMLKQASAQLSLPVPSYVQLEGKVSELAPVLELASKNGLMLCVTYSKSPTGRYGGQRIAHMVNAPHWSKNWVAILDNNYPGDSSYEWMTPEEYTRVCTGGSGGIWAVILLNPCPPPCPHTPKMVSTVRGTVPVPGEAAVDTRRFPGEWNYGVNLDKIPLEGRYSVNGVPVSKDMVLAAVEGNVPDLTNKVRITVIGDKEKRQSALAKIGKPTWAVVADYSPAYWAVQPQKYGFVTGGSPTIYFQRPDGSVLCRLDDETGLVDALRKADPSYDPSKDPDGKAKPVTYPTMTAGALPTFAGGVGTAAGGYALWKWVLPLVLGFLRKKLGNGVSQDDLLRLEQLILAITQEVQKGKTNAQ